MRGSRLKVGPVVGSVIGVHVRQRRTLGQEIAMRSLFGPRRNRPASGASGATPLGIGRARSQLGVGLSDKWPIRVLQSSRPGGSEDRLVHDLVKIEKGCARGVEGHATGDRMGIAVGVVSK